MFDRFRKESQALQLYGKLPLAKDYLRVGASKGAGRELREWLDDAFSSRAISGSAPSFPWPARFVIGASNGDPVMGIAWPSSDQGGERAFPFAVFVERRRKALTSAFGEGLLELCRVWAELDECHSSSRDYADGQSFLAGMRGREVEITARPVPGPPGISLDAWANAIWPEAGQEGLVELFVSLSRLGKEDYRGPLRLPLVAGLPIVSQVHGWWSALVFLALLPEAALPTAFFPVASGQDEEPVFVSFFRSSIRLDDAAWISSARTATNLGAGDFAIEHCAMVDPSEPTPERSSRLAESMRGALATARGRA